MAGNQVNSATTFTAVDVTNTTNLPAGTVTSSHWSSRVSDRLSQDKSEHQKSFTNDFVTADVGSSLTYYAHRSPGAGNIVDFEVSVDTLPATYSYTVDLQKASDASTSFSTVLSGTVAISSSDTAGTLKAGTISAATLAADDRLRVVITRAGGSGTEADGWCITVVTEEDAI